LPWPQSLRSPRRQPLPSPRKGAVLGTFKKDCFGCGDEELIGLLRASHVWCAWDGDHVIVHITLRNRSNARLKVYVQPSYRIYLGGKHGSGFGSIKDTQIDGRGFKSWYIDVGKPKGVEAKSRITHCIPSLYLLKTD
jgi:hypothetical protein